MAKRFKNLNYALKTLRPPNSTQPAPDAPQGSIAREYQDFKAGKRVIQYPRSADSKPGSLEIVSVLPFYYAGDDTKQTLVKQSQRSDTETTLDGVQTACNQLTADLDAHIRLENFIPAKAVVTVFSGTETQETSRITGIRYNKKAAKSYTFPYGASAAEKAERNVRQDIVAAVNLLTNASVSFSSEKI